MLQYRAPFDILGTIMHRGALIFRFLPILSLCLIVESCVVLNPIGDAISDGYENTLTYFNVYYNAKRAFDDAEADILDAAKKERGKTTPGSPASTIPSTAAKNLDLVIDKCSNILTFHSKSSFVDDALMMTGKAFYYKGDYSKADRKFLELITQFPNSSLNLEAQLWYAKSELNLQEYDQARSTTTSLIASAEASGDRDILARAYFLMGSIAVHDGSTTTAIETYQTSANVARSDQLKADAWFQIGKLYFDDGQYENSIDAFFKVVDNSDDVYQIFQSDLLATQAYRNLSLLDKALALENTMAKDYRFKDFLGAVMLERANILLAGKRYDEAINLYQIIDTTYTQTGSGAAADFELGKYYEHVGGDFQKAKEYYRRATMVTSSPVLNPAARKVIAFNLYFADLKELSNADSLQALVVRVDSVHARRDSLTHSSQDTSAAGRDSTTISNVSHGIRLSADSLDAIRARAAAGLGELFYTDLANPDSAFFWLQYSLKHQYVEHTAPRILYILSQLASSYPDKTTVSSKDYQDQIVRGFPNSYFAKQILHGDVGQEAELVAIDSAAIAYKTAESFLEAGENEKALTALQTTIQRFPASPLVVKCRYAIGWLYENRLSKMDSAAAEYKLLIAQYPGTPYARAVSQRQLDTLSNTPAKADTMPPNSLVQPQKKDTLQVGQAGGLGTKQTSSKPPGTLSRRAKILQSQNAKPTERE